MTTYIKFFDDKDREEEIDLYEYIGNGKGFKKHIEEMGLIWADLDAEKAFDFFRPAGVEDRAAFDRDLMADFLDITDGYITEPHLVLCEQQGRLLKLDDFTYFGEFPNDGGFAHAVCMGIYSIPGFIVPCVDWKLVAMSMMDDYVKIDQYYFKLN